MKKIVFLIVAAIVVCLIAAQVKAATFNSTVTFKNKTVKYKYHAYLSPAYNGKISGEELKQALLWLVAGDPRGNKYFNLKYYTADQIIADYKSTIKCVYGADMKKATGTDEVTDDDLIAVINNTTFQAEPADYYTNYFVWGIKVSDNTAESFKPNPNSQSEKNDPYHELGYCQGKAWIKRNCANPTGLSGGAIEPIDEGEVEGENNTTVVTSKTTAATPNVTVINNVSTPAPQAQYVQTEQPQYQQPLLPYYPQYSQPYSEPFLGADLSAGIYFGGGYNYGQNYYGGGYGQQWPSKNVYIDNSVVNNNSNNTTTTTTVNTGGNGGHHGGGNGGNGGNGGSNNGGPVQGNSGGSTYPSPGTDPNTGPGQRGNPFATRNPGTSTSIAPNSFARNQQSTARQNVSPSSYFNPSIQQVRSPRTSPSLASNTMPNRPNVAVNQNAGQARSYFNNPSLNGIQQRSNVQMNNNRPRGIANQNLAYNRRSGIQQPTVGNYRFPQIQQPSGFAQRNPSLMRPQMQMHPSMMGGGGGFRSSFGGRPRGR